MIFSRDESEFVATRAWVANRTVFMELADSRQTGFPAARFNCLAQTADEQSAEVTLRLGGSAMRWKTLDEDITVTGAALGRFQAALPLAAWQLLPDQTHSPNSKAAQRSTLTLA